MFNLVWWELARLARRGHAARARILLLYGLLLGIVVFAILERGNPMPLFQGNATLDLKSADRFSRQLVFILLESQLLLVALITPAYAVSAIAEEKDRHTLSLLLTTALSDRDIVWGKAIARVLFVLAAVVCGIPVLVFTQMFGGVHVELIAAGYVLTIGTVVLVAALGIKVATEAPDTRRALSLAYFNTFIFLVIVPLCSFSPFAILLIVREDPRMWPLAVGSLVVQSLLAGLILLHATQKLRKLSVTAGPLPATDFPEPPRGRAMPVLRGVPEVPLHPMGALGAGDPVLWRERHAKSGPLGWDWLVTVVVMVVSVWLFLTGGLLLTQRAMKALDPHEAVRFVASPGSPDHAGLLLMISGTMAAWLYVWPLAIGVTDSIAGERFRGTLDSLLLSLLDRPRVLWAKIRVQVEHRLACAVWAAASFGAGFGSEGGVLLGFAAIAAFVGGIVFVVGSGVWLSVRCRTPVIAFRLCLPALLTVCAFPVFAWCFIDWENTSQAVAVLAWCAGLFAMVGGACGWRASLEFEGR